VIGLDVQLDRQPEHFRERVKRKWRNQRERHRTNSHRVPQLGYCNRNARPTIRARFRRLVSIAFPM